MAVLSQDAKYRWKMIREREKRTAFFKLLAGLRGTCLRKLDYVILSSPVILAGWPDTFAAWLDEQGSRWEAIDAAEERQRYWLRQTGVRYSFLRVRLCCRAFWLW